MSKHVHLNRSLEVDSQTSSDSSEQSLSSKHRRGIILCEEFRLIERSEAQINGAWRGAHILLFFLAFIFGSFCTFCFHTLMYMFDDKCVLFPKLLSVKSDRHNSMHEIMPIKDKNKTLRVEFVNAQWMDHSVCYLPVYVPLVSGIFGLIWITMFLMCSAGTRTHAGLHSPWRVLFPVFLFSVAMSIVCVQASSVTQSGLQAFCDTLSEITNGSPCSYAVNVVSLAYHRRIRGVYQATQLTIISAWLHTVCWLCSVALVLVRVVLAVDFQLVRVRAELVGDIDLMLQRNEKQIRTISPESEANVDLTEQQSPSHDYPQNPREITSAMGLAITDKQEAADTTLKEDRLPSKQLLTSSKSKLSNELLPQIPPAKSPAIITTEEVDNTAAATENKNTASSLITSLFIHSPVPSLSESNNRIMQIPNIIAMKEPQQSAAENNVPEPYKAEHVEDMSKKQKTDTLSPSKSINQNVSKDKLTHRPSLVVTQIKETVDHEESRQSKGSPPRSLLSRIDIKASSAKLMLIASSQKIQSDKQVTESAEPQHKPDELGLPEELPTIKPLSFKDDEASWTYKPITAPDKSDEARRPTEPIVRPENDGEARRWSVTKSQRKKHNEASQSKEVIPGSVKDGEASQSKKPTVTRSPPSEKDDEATHFKESIAARENDREAISKEPVIALENDGESIPQARRWSVASNRRLRSDKDDEASQSKKGITK